MNAILQALCTIPSIIDLCRKRNDESGDDLLSTLLCTAVRSMTSECGQVSRHPPALYHLLPWTDIVPPGMERGVDCQEDAGEFLDLLLEAARLTGIKDLFARSIKISRQCTLCSYDNTTRQIETVFRVSLHGKNVVDVAAVVKSRATSFEDFFACECGQALVWQMEHVTQRPKVWVVALQRFQFYKGASSKMHNTVLLSEEIKDVNGVDLSLTAVVCHRGNTLTSGHYYTYGRLPGTSHVGPAKYVF